MGVAFKEVFAYTGFSSETPSGGPGIMIPQNGARLVLLEGGTKDLKVAPTVKAMLTVEEIKDERRRHDAISKMVFPRSTTEKASAWTSIKAGTARLFQISANTHPGTGLKVEALYPMKKNPEATLKVTILKQLPVKIAIRRVQVRDDKGMLVFSSLKEFDPKVLRDEMNAIWTPQANVVFELSKIDPVVIEQLKPGQPADITNEELKKEFIAQKDPDAMLTFFMVKRAINKESPDLGVIDSQAGISLISDDRSDSTMAHEAGHFLGSLSESGKFSMRYGHQGKDADLLMRAGGAGRKIPFGMVTDFNKGYRA